MTSSSITKPVNMHDTTKYSYHSIPMEAPRAIPLTERSSACVCSKKVLTMILASSLLWIIILDIILVIYKTHHLKKLSDTEHACVEVASHSSRMIHLGVSITKASDIMEYNSTSSPSDSGSTDMNISEPAITLETTPQSITINKRVAISGDHDFPYARLSSWLSRRYDHDSARLHKTDVTAISDKDVIEDTTSSTVGQNDISQRLLPQHALIPLFDDVVPPAPPPFLSMLPRSHRFHEQRPRRPWMGLGHWRSRGRLGTRRTDGTRKEDQWREAVNRFPRPIQIGPRLTPFAPHEIDHPSSQWISNEIEGEKLSALSKSQVSHRFADTPNKETDPVAAFFKTIKAFVDGSWNATETEESGLNEFDSKNHEKFHQKNMDQDKDSVDTIIDTDILMTQ